MEPDTHRAARISDYQFVDRLDTYFSLMLGLKIISWD